MTVQRNQRVALDGRTPGTVLHPDEQNGRVFVALDNGCSGNFAASRLVPLVDKSWPPGGLETKTAG